MTPTGRTIGILGGGQLGRMLALAAAPLGYRCHIFSPESNSPASEIGNLSTVAEYTDEKALEKFAKDVDIITYEFENVPVCATEVVSSITALHPSQKSLLICRNRVKEKTFAQENKISVAPWLSVINRNALTDAVKKIGTPCILKSSELGYDGKGQTIITSDKKNDLDNAWLTVGANDCILEQKISFKKEISVIIARDLLGNMKSYTPCENIHKNGILDHTIAPILTKSLEINTAKNIATTIAKALDHVGVLCVELFVESNGNILLNEIAPRVHNSGHWTIEACGTSQFTQHIRAITGLPLQEIYQHSSALMKNLIGEDISIASDLIKTKNAHVHLYGKKKTMPGRKMGHVTWLNPTNDIRKLYTS